MNSVTPCNTTQSNTLINNNPVRRCDGVVINSDTVMFPDMDKVELSKRGIALAEKRSKTPWEPPKVDVSKLPPNVVDNTDGYEAFLLQEDIKQGYTYVGYGRNIRIKHRDVKQYDLSNLPDADRRVSYHDFFDNDYSFLADAAKEYAKINQEQDFLYRPTQDNEFVRNTLDWIYGNDVKQTDIDAMHSQVDTIVRELAEQVKDGKEPDITLLSSKFSFRGDEISVSGLMEVQKITDKLLNIAKPGTGGSGNTVITFESRAIRGLVKSLSSFCYQNLPGNIGERFQKLFDDKINPDIESGKIYDNNLKYLEGEYKQRVIDRNAAALEHFASLDSSSLEGMNHSFEEQLLWYKNTIEEQFYRKTDRDDAQVLRDIYNSVMERT